MQSFSAKHEMWEEKEKERERERNLEETESSRRSTWSARNDRMHTNRRTRVEART